MEMIKSIVGRKLGLSSTGGLIQAYNSTGKNSTDFIMAAQMWGSGMLTTYSSSEARLANCGIDVISSATSTSYTFTVVAPVTGIGVEIISQSSATTLTLQTSATTILFFDTTFGPAGATGLVLSVVSTDGGNYGASVVLRGLSATRYQITQKPRSSTAAL